MPFDKISNVCQSDDRVHKACGQVGKKHSKAYKFSMLIASKQSCEYVSRNIINTVRVMNKNTLKQMRGVLPSKIPANLFIYSSVLLLLSITLLN